MKTKSYCLILLKIRIMKKNLEFIFKYLNIALGNNKKHDGFSIHFLGNNEIQMPSDNGGLTNYVFSLEDNPLYAIITEILNHYYMIEFNKWCEHDKSDNHIFPALESLRLMIKDLEDIYSAEAKPFQFSAEEQEKIKAIRNRFFELGWNAEYCDDFEVKRKEEKAIQIAEQDFENYLKQGIVADKYLNWDV